MKNLHHLRRIFAGLGCALLVSACIVKDAGTAHNLCGTFDSCDAGLTARRDKLNMCVCERSCRRDSDCKNGDMCRRKRTDDLELINICVAR